MRVVSSRMTMPSSVQSIRAHWWNYDLILVEHGEGGVLHHILHHIVESPRENELISPYSRFLETSHFMMVFLFV